MQIAGISTIASAAPAFHPVLAARSQTPSPAGNTTPRERVPNPPSTPPSGSSARNPPEPAKDAHPETAKAPSTQTNAPITGYSTMVAGVAYTGSVEVDGGDYLASVPYLAGAIADGPSVQSAEDNLNTRIDVLV